jgi:Predicted RNA-binding protein (contains KH domain)
MSTIDQQFVEYIVKTLVNNPDKVSIDRTIDEKGVLLSLEVDPEDVGRIIGKRGATAQSIRTLLRALGTKNDARYNLKIVNNDDYQPKAKTEEKAAVAADDSFASEDDDATEADDTDIELADDDTTVEEGSELAKKTRAELADLDDLDI